MDPKQSAQAVVDALEALHQSLVDAWLSDSNSGQYDLAQRVNALADRAGDQLIEARQYLLGVIDSGQDITDLINQMDGLAAAITSAQDQVAAGARDLDEVRGVLDTIDQVVQTAKGLSK